MSRDFTPRELLAFEKYNIENGGLSILDFKKSLVFTYKDKSEFLNKPEDIAICEQYGLIGKLYEPFNKLYDSLSKTIGGLELLSVKEKELETYVNLNIGDENSYLIKWFNGELDRSFYYSEYNNELFLNNILEEVKNLTFNSLEDKILSAENEKNNEPIRVKENNSFIR